MNLKNITISIAGKTFIENTTINFDENKHYGLIGKNGAGKTTLFKAIKGEFSLDSGEIEKKKNLKIKSVNQDIPSGDISALNFVIESDAYRLDLLKQLEICTDEGLISDIYDKLISMDAFSAESKASKILNGLGFSEEMQNKSLDHFSGGFRMRIALAAALFGSPDLLLLDEPTNHLDLETVTWLKNFLKNYQNTLIVISHDRDLLNTCIDEIVYLNAKKLTKYKGNYDTFEKTIALQKKNIEAFNKKVDAQKEKWMSFVSRFSAKATKAPQAQSRLKAIQKLQYLDTINQDENNITFSFPSQTQLSHPFFNYEKVFLGYASDEKKNIILKYISGAIMPGERIALLGINGSGKSTFAKFLAGILSPLKGNVIKDPNLRIGYFHQHQLETLKMNQTPYAHINELMKNATDTQIRTHLGNFGFAKEKADLEVKFLSGGEKSRLVFAMICVNAPHMLILDEPTNHLDIQMRESLIRAVNLFPGVVIVISHDWHFLSHTVDKIIFIENQKIIEHKGDLKNYLKFYVKK